MSDARTEQSDHIRVLAADVSLDGQIAELKREIAMRGNAYPHFVAKGKLTQEKADKQTAAMLAALHTLMAVKAAPDLLAALKVTFACLREPVGAAFRDLHPATWRRIEETISKAEGRT